MSRATVRGGVRWGGMVRWMVRLGEGGGLTLVIVFVLESLLAFQALVGPALGRSLLRRSLLGECGGRGGALGASHVLGASHFRTRQRFGPGPLVLLVHRRISLPHVLIRPRNMLPTKLLRLDQFVPRTPIPQRTLPLTSIAARVQKQVPLLRKHKDRADTSAVTGVSAVVHAVLGVHSWPLGRVGWKGVRPRLSHFPLDPLLLLRRLRLPLTRQRNLRIRLYVAQTEVFFLVGASLLAS